MELCIRKYPKRKSVKLRERMCKELMGLSRLQSIQKDFSNSGISEFNAIITKGLRPNNCVVGKLPVQFRRYILNDYIYQLIFCTLSSDVRVHYLDCIGEEYTKLDFSSTINLRGGNVCE